MLVGCKFVYWRESSNPESFFNVWQKALFKHDIPDFIEIRKLTTASKHFRQEYINNTKPPENIITYLRTVYQPKEIDICLQEHKVITFNDMVDVADALVCNVQELLESSAENSEDMEENYYDDTKFDYLLNYKDDKNSNAEVSIDNAVNDH